MHHKLITPSEPIQLERQGRLWEGGPINFMETTEQQDLVELLFLALYQDGHLSLDEDSMLQKALDSLGWKPDEKTGPSVGRAFAQVRAANSSDESKEAFLAERTARLKKAGHSAIALEWLGKVLASDGLDDQESRFLDRVKDMLF